ncbi:hypothetical protein ACQKWADRAFT_126953, partial [Trichoderma austrokoningii]
RSRRERAARLLAAASRAVEVKGSDLTPDSSPATKSSEPKASRHASTAATTPMSSTATVSDEPHPTSSHRGTDQLDALTQARTTESSTRRRRRSDEDANGPERKRRRVTSEGAEDGDAGRSDAGPYKPRPMEATATSTRAVRRKRIAASLHDTRNKRPIINYDPVPSFTQPPEGVTDLFEFARDIEPPRASRASSSHSAAVRPGYDLYEERIQMGLRDFESNSPASTDDDISFTTAQSSLKEEKEAIMTEVAPKRHPTTEPCREMGRPLGDVDGPVAKIPTISPDTREVDKGTRDPRRQRVARRRSRGGVQKNHASPSVQQLLRSSRSSRRDLVQEFWFLGDDGTTCAVENGKRR